ncbi:MAG TPA: hypothetical protein VGJ42_01740 [Nitrososphaera sp.]|jgi:hypothetical protein
MNKAIENSEQNIPQGVKAVSENYKNFLSANVSCHLQLRGMAEIYQWMLERICLDPGYSGSPLQ